MDESSTCKKKMPSLNVRIDQSHQQREAKQSVEDGDDRLTFDQ